MKMSFTGKNMLFIVYMGVFLLLLLISSLIQVSYFVEIKSLGNRMWLRDRIIPPARSASIAIVTIDKYSTRALGERWPWKRDRHTALIQTLASRARENKGPRVIAFDLKFPPRDDAGDEAFSAIIKEFRKVVVALGADPEEMTEKLVLVPLASSLKKAGPYTGNIVITSEPDERVYCLPLFRYMEDPVTGEMLMVELFERTIAELFTGSTIEIRQNYFLLGGHKIPLYITAQHRKLAHLRRCEFLISYRGSPEQTFPSYHFSDVVQGKIPAEVFDDKAVLVINTLDPNDRFKTTVGNYIFGGYLHAYGLRTLIEQDAITPCIDLYILLYLPLALAAVIILLKVRKRSRAFYMIVLFLAVYVAFCYGLFIFFSLWIPIVIPVTGVFIFSACYLFLEYHFMKQTLRALLPSSFADRLDPFSADFKAGGKPILATVLFADIRGYTNLSETLSSEEVFNMLVEYHTAVKGPLQENGGEIFDFQGDAYMVVFGADGKTTDHARKAVTAALGICRAVEELKKKWTQQGRKDFDVGIGICTGEVTLGYIGHTGGGERKLQPAAIGDTTNVAARVQGKSAELKTPVLMTESTQMALEGNPPTIALTPVELKGKSKKLLIYTVDWDKVGPLPH